MLLITFNIWFVLFLCDWSVWFMIISMEVFVSQYISVPIFILNSRVVANKTKGGKLTDKTMAVDLDGDR